MENEGRKAREHWSDDAERYERSSAIRKVQTEMTIRVLEELKLGKNSKVLDIGCGTGFSLEALEGHDCIGIDISSEMLGFARKRSNKLVQGTFVSLPFRDESFDAIISISAIQWHEGKDIHDVIDFYRALRDEMHRVLKKDGKAGIQFYPQSKEIEDMIKRLFKKKFDGYLMEEGKGKKLKKYVILQK